MNESRSKSYIVSATVYFPPLTTPINISIFIKKTNITKNFFSKWSYLLNMEETRICKACDVEKPLTQFHKCMRCAQGTVGVCKVCKSKGRTVPKDYKTPKFNQKWSLTDDKVIRLYGASKEDYLLMYELIRTLGYNPDGDVNQQFLDKWNEGLKKPMKRKIRDYKNQNYYLPNGEKNPQWRSTSWIKKNPND